MTPCLNTSAKPFLRKVLPICEYCQRWQFVLKFEECIPPFPIQKLAPFDAFGGPAYAYFESLPSWAGSKNSFRRNTDNQNEKVWQK